MTDSPAATQRDSRKSASLHSKHQDASSEQTLQDIEQPSSLDAEKDRALPPDGGYGWVCVVCNACINAHTWGINSAYGVFLGYYLSSNAFPGTSALAYAFVGGLSISQAMLIAPLATYVVHRFGTRASLNTGIFFETLALIGASFATKLWHLILSQGVCFGWGMGFLFTASVGILPQWFLKRRSLANSLSAAGSGLGALIYSLAAGRAIQTVGLPWTFRILAICTFSVNIIACNLLRDRNKLIGTRNRAFDLSILRRPEFLLVQAWGCFSMLGYVVIVFSIPAYARSIGLSESQGYILNAIVSLGQMLGRPIIGLTSDRYGRINLACLYSLCSGLAIFAFWIPTEAAPSPYGLLIFYSIVGGGLAGTFWTTIAPVSTEVVGLKDLPGALSLTWLLLVPPTTVSQPIALELRSLNQQHWVYLHPQIFTGFMYVAGAMCLWVLRGWKIGQVEEVERRVLAAKRRSVRTALVEKQEEKAQDELAGKELQGGELLPDGGGNEDAIETAASSRHQRNPAAGADEATAKPDTEAAEAEKVDITPAVIERIGTQEDVRDASWRWRDLLRRMCKLQKV
ncbi:putative transporter MCH2 [Cyphellophora attinorum]|uniref:Putative transporter MCH2 n=1 Tax=Cyphellophora attinorum TaxID=1664694 RepID=A0A0N1H5T9_9EURO|nr:putative transporter MCH2 [Phialophora attinorum]KPI37866.1 putative transporter MCH2 [Phialophora attinorum]